MQNEKWQVEVNGNIYDCEFAELEQWIAERALLPEDNVRRGNRGWVKAGRVPALQKIFAGEKPPDKSQTDSSPLLTEPSQFEQPRATLNITESRFEKQNLDHSTNRNSASCSPEFDSNACYFHQDQPADYVCRECDKRFCKSCPKSYGTVRICPACGEMCRPFKHSQANSNKTVALNDLLKEEYGFKDFGRAWVYPFKFWQSLGLGALFVAFLSLGGFFGILLANAILFGCIAQAINHIAHGNWAQNFMPDFDDFNVWDDVVKPFLLSIGVLAIAYLPVGLVMFSLFFSVLNSLSNPAAVIKAEQENSIAAVKESVSTQLLLEQKASEKQSSNDETIIASGSKGPLDEKDVKALINGNADEQAAAVKKVEEISGNSPAVVPPHRVQKTDAQIMYSIIEPIFKSSPLIILLLMAALLWAIFYLPVALIIAGYTRSLRATINPLVGIDTMRRMGKVYLTAFLFCLVVQLVNLALSGFIGYLTKPFDLPLLGNLPANFLTAMCSFYFSLVIAFLLGAALFKTADRLGIRAI